MRRGLRGCHPGVTRAGDGSLGALDSQDGAGERGRWASAVLQRLWGAAVTGTAQELLNSADDDENASKNAKASATEFLRELLKDGSMPAATVEAERKDAGHAISTIRRAAASLGVLKRKDGMSGGWYWQLPEDAQKQPKVSTQNDEHLQHLREDLSTFGEG